METPTVSIDLGASYTKVAYRKKLRRSGGHRFATADTRAAVLEGTATIPSVMIQTTDRKRPWIAGTDAANTTPSEKMTVFENWKSALYSSAFDAKKVDLVWVAGNFFKWLVEGLDGIGVDFDGDCRVRVTIPALKRIEEQKDALIHCMHLNGWPGEIEVVDEPAANIIGVLSAGRNVVSASGQISYQPTFGDAEGTGVTQLNYIYGEIRKYALGSRQKRHMKVSVVDFGSFTLDVASLTLDLDVVDHSRFPIDSVESDSWEVGVIEDIDKPSFDELFARHEIDSAALSFGVKESAKVALYAGEPYAVAFGRGRVTLGESELDKRTVDDAIGEYCSKAWAKLSRHWEDSEVVILTGGGTCIPAVRDFFEGVLEEEGVKNIVDFAADERADDTELPSDGLHRWEKVGEGLGRLATGLGGASIGFGFEPDGPCRDYIPPGAHL
jgi:hypothetical protein